MRTWWRSLFSRGQAPATSIDHVNRLRGRLAALDDDALKAAGRRAATLPDVVAVTAVVASRVLGLQMFDVQIQGALALADGKVVEMQTGEGKTLAAVPAVAWYARTGAGRARAHGQRLPRPARRRMDGRRSTRGSACRSRRSRRASTVTERRAAYRADITYATANEVGFD